MIGSSSFPSPTTSASPGVPCAVGTCFALSTVALEYTQFLAAQPYPFLGEHPMKRRMLTSATAWGLRPACLLLAVFFTPSLVTAGSTRPAPLPEDLAAVPQHAMAFMHIRVADLWNSPPAKFAL